MIDTFTIRCNILHLAFSGKLTNQIKEEGTAKDILDLISNRKPLVSVEDGPYTLPDSWAWVRLKDLYKINPRIIADNDTEAAFIPMERISGGFDRSFTFEIQKWEKASKNHTKFEDGDIAFAKITPCFENRKSFIAQDLPNGIGGGTTELIILRQKEMLPQYTYYLVLDQRFISTGTASYKGVVGQQRVQSDVIKNYLVPVAPYSEQKRIVKKIEQVFSILDTIDELQAQYADNLTALKSKLIDAAIQGKLTEQLPEDGTAEELYQQIQEEKQKLIKEGKIKKQKPLPEITDDEIPFDIPENWKWVRLGKLISIESGRGLTASNMNPGDFPVYGGNGIAGYHNCGFVPSKTIVIGRVGYYCGSVHITEKESWVTDNAFVTSYPEKHIDKYYLAYTLQHMKLGQNNNGAAQPVVSGKKIYPLAFPLPPLAEQKRIVQKLEEILPLCKKQ
ncbi:type I restriction enzyme, S subunit [Ruminococcaceae bacterium P7]|nr:type I restriction enzyme, S subunit [Ruminococcaceae bacterium P7]